MKDLEFSDRMLERQYATEAARKSIGAAMLLRAVCIAAWLVTFKHASEARCAWPIVAVQLIMVVSEICTLAFLILDRDCCRHEQIKAYLFVLEKACMEVSCVLAPERIYYGLGPPCLTGLWVTFSQVRLSCALKLHSCNAIMFATLQLNEYMYHGSPWLILRDVVGYLAIGLLLPLVVGYYTEQQGRQTFVSKACGMSAAQLGY